MTEYKPIKPNLTRLIDDAPLTTRTNVPIYVGELIGESFEALAEYRRAPLLETSIRSLRRIIEEGDEITLISDSIIVKPEYLEYVDFPQEFWFGEPITIDALPPDFVLVHELTHAYLDRYQKENRGFVSLVRKISKDPELEKKLMYTLGELEKSIVIPSIKIEMALSDMDEALAYAVSSLYGGRLPTTEEGLEPFDYKKFSANLKACKELIDFTGIDGARAFVRRKMREMYTMNKEGKTLSEEVEDYRQTTAAFFVHGEI